MCLYILACWSSLKSSKLHNFQHLNFLSGWKNKWGHQECLFSLTRHSWDRRETAIQNFWGFFFACRASQGIQILVLALLSPDSCLSLCVFWVKCASFVKLECWDFFLIICSLKTPGRQALDLCSLDKMTVLNNIEKMLLFTGWVVKQMCKKFV